MAHIDTLDTLSLWEYCNSLNIDACEFDKSETELSSILAEDESILQQDHPIFDKDYDIDSLSWLCKIPTPNLPMPKISLTPDIVPNLPVLTSEHNLSAVVKPTTKRTLTMTSTNDFNAQLPLMFETKLDCPRQGGCTINIVQSLPGGSVIKGMNAIGSKHKFSCGCGLSWKENNWRERERLQNLGVSDTRCVEFTISRRVCNRVSK